MSTNKIILVVGGALLVYSLIIYPVQLAHGVQTAIGWLTGGVESTVTFMHTLFT